MWRFHAGIVPVDGSSGGVFVMIVTFGNIGNLPIKLFFCLTKVSLKRGIVL